MAKELLKNSNMIIAVEKVTRAGATTNLIKEAVNAKRKIVFCSPTHKIGEDTVKQSVSLSQRKDARILYLKGNEKICLKLNERLTRNLRLKKMKWHMLPQKCAECQYNLNPECPLQEILLTQDWDILVITYQKLKALVNSQEHSEISAAIISKLFSADIMIVDEYTQGLLGLTPTVELSWQEQDKLFKLFLDDWSSALVPLLEFNFDILEEAFKLQKGKYQVLANPLSAEILQSLKENARFLWNKLTHLTGKGYDTEFLQELYSIAFSPRFFLHRNRKDQISLKPLEPLTEGISFVNDFVDSFTAQGKLSFLVDSHLPDLKLHDLFKSKFTKVFWGDPNDTNSYIAYFCDSKSLTFHSLRFPETQEYLQNTIKEICTYHLSRHEKSLNDVLIVCMNKAMQRYVKQWKNQGLIPDIPDDNITYYRSKLTRGVPFYGTVQIMLCGPYIPLAAYYHKTQLGDGETAKMKAWDYAFRKSSMVSDYINASTRVKDPEGKRDSYIYCLGMTKQQVDGFLDITCEMYHNGSAKPPFIIAPLTTGMTAERFVAATRLFECRSIIAEPRTDISYLLRLSQVKDYYLRKGETDPVPFKRIFRATAKQASEVFKRNENWLKKANIIIKRHQNGGQSLVL
ncbi:MAG: hypothetical protein GX811_07715 [Lentisphaerae bacterium]|nr:hypothetical protein [Lentisphaerota bacterium]